MDPLPLENVSGPTTQQQQPVIVIVQAPVAGTSDDDHFKKFFPKKAIKAMSITMLVAGALSTIFQLILMFLPSGRGPRHHYSAVGQGIWCGVFFLLTGGLGVSSANKPSQCSIITVMVFSILSACMAVPHMTLDGIFAGEISSWRSWRSSLEYADLGICLYSFMFVLGITGGITSIVLSAYTCRATCCRRSKLGTVLYNPAAAGAAGDPQAIPLGNLDPSKFIATQQTSGLASQQQPPSYSTVIQPSYNQPNVPTGAGQTDLEGRTLVNDNTTASEADANSLAGGDDYKRFY